MAGFPTGPYVLVELPNTEGAVVSTMVPVDFDTDTVGTIKQLLNESRGIPEAVQRLTPQSLRGEELSDHQRLDEWGNGAAFDLWLTDHARVYVWVPSSTLVQFVVPMAVQVRHIEDRLRNLMREHSAVFELSCCCVVLDGSAVVGDVLAHPDLFGHWRLRLIPRVSLRGSSRNP